MTNKPENPDELRTAVSQRYARTALEVLGKAPEEASSDCCGGSGGCCSTSSSDPVTRNLYSGTELNALPASAAQASLGCGNPTALASLQPGEKVLDLGSGGGIDVLLSAKRVGPTGLAYGLDMTEAMLELAEQNRVEAGVENVRFLKGVIEAIPLPANAVDVVISNCVINLSADKAQVLREAYRVLVPGGRLAVSDIVFLAHFPAALQRDMEVWAGCMAGALEEETYQRFLTEAGFDEITFEITRRYTLDEITASGGGTTLQALSAAERAQIEGKFVSAFIRARKPL